LPNVLLINWRLYSTKLLKINDGCLLEEQNTFVVQWQGGGADERSPLVSAVQLARSHGGDRVPESGIQSVRAHQVRGLPARDPEGIRRGGGRYGGRRSPSL